MKIHQKFLIYLKEVLGFWKEGIDWIQLIVTFFGIIFSSLSFFFQQNWSLILLLSGLLLFVYANFKIFTKYKNFGVKIELDQIRGGSTLISSGRIRDVHYVLPFYVYNHLPTDIYVKKVVVSCSNLEWFGVLVGNGANKLKDPKKIASNDTDRIEIPLNITTKLDLVYNNQHQELYDSEIMNAVSPVLDVEITVKMTDGEETYKLQSDGIKLFPKNNLM